MKYTHQLLLQLGLILVPVSAYSQQFNANAQVATFALTETSSEPSLALKDPDGKIVQGETTGYNQFTITTLQGGRAVRRVTTTEQGEKMVVKRISNKEILEKLVDEDVIDTIVGYSIVFITQENSEGQSTKFSLRKRGLADTDISQYVNATYQAVGAGNNSYTRVDTTDIVRDTDSTTEKGSGMGKGRINLSFEFTYYNINCVGVINWADSLRTFTNAESRRSYSLYVPASSRILAITGSAAEDLRRVRLSEETVTADDDENLVEGTVNFAAGVPMVIQDSFAD